MPTKDRAVCLRAIDYSETSQIVTLFGRLSGKIRAIAKGSKRAKSAFDGPIEALSFGDIVFSGARKEGLATLTEFQQQPVPGRLRGHLFTLNSALFAAELLDRLTDEYDPHPDLFDHLIQFFEDVEAGRLESGRRDILIRLVLFQLALLHEVGLRPVLSACANCKRKFEVSSFKLEDRGADRPASNLQLPTSDFFFSHAANGLVCRDCEMSFPDKLLLSARAAKCLTDVTQIGTADEKALDEIERVLVHHFTGILGYRPRMAEYVQKEHL